MRRESEGRGYEEEEEEEEMLAVKPTVLEWWSMAAGASITPSTRTNDTET